MATATKPPTAAKRLFEVATTGRQLPGRYLFYGPEKIGKTSLAAQAPSPIFFQAKGETGLETLIDAGLLPPTAHLPGELGSWDETLEGIQWLSESTHEFKTLVIDGVDSLQSLCFQHIRDSQFGGDDGKFMAYHKGFAMAPNTWKELLASLDGLRVKRKMAIVMVSHVRVSKKKNPSGEDWTAYTPNLNEAIWEQTAAWLDAILFMDFYRKVSEDGKGKGDASVRTIYCEHDATYDAGNRFGLRDEIDCGNSPQEAWANLSAAIKSARTQKEN